MENHPTKEFYRGRFIIYSAECLNDRDHPYEDSADFFNEELQKNGRRYFAAVIADGVTRVKENGEYPEDSPSKIMADAVSKEIINFIKQKLSETASNENLEEIIKQALIQANQKAREINKELGLWDQEKYQLAATTATAALLEHSPDGKINLFWASVGDSPLLVIKPDGRVERINPNQSENIQKHKDEIKKIFPEGINWSKIHRNELRNQQFFIQTETGEQIDVGYWAITGEEQVNDAIQSGVVEIQRGDIVIVASDGFLEMGLDPIEAVMKDQTISLDQKLEAIINRIREEVHNQGKRSDDITALMIFQNIFL